MKRISGILLLLAISFASCMHNKDHEFNSLKERDAILRVLDIQTKAWNQGDIPGFMEGYWKSDSLVFIGSNGINQGWDNTLQRYQTAYPNREKMGNLRFEIRSLDVMDPYHAHVIGSYALSSDLDSLIGTGFFTLLWKKINGKWVITVDQTCG